MAKFKMIALHPGDVRKVEYLNSGVIFHIVPLPHKVKEDLINQASFVALNTKEVQDYAAAALTAIQYGVCGWDNLNYEDGSPSKCELVDCSIYKVKCLSKESLELLVRTPAYEDLADMCVKPEKVEYFIRLNAEMQKQEAKENEKQPVLDPLEKKS